MDYVTSIGLDVHARSITAAALDPATGELTTAVFRNDTASLIEWIDSFACPTKVVYESGVTGFHLQRVLSENGINCVIGAVSKMFRPAADKRRKNDRNDAIFLARMHAANNIVSVWVPDTECEAERNLFRAYEDSTNDLTRAKQRLSKFLLRHGYVFDERNADGSRVTTWTKKHWVWLRNITFAETADALVYQHYLECVQIQTGLKTDLTKQIKQHAGLARWKPMVDALKCLKGIDTISAFALAVEVGCFTRFSNARGFAAWLGLVPSEHSSGSSERRGGITKAGNTHLRRLLVEASWTYTWTSPHAKALLKNQVVAPHIRSHATRGIRRLSQRRRALLESGKTGVVANTATARELSMWIWAVGTMVEAVQAS